MTIIGNVDTLYFSLQIENYAFAAQKLLTDLQEITTKKYINRSIKVEYYNWGGILFEVTNGRYSWSYGLRCDDFWVFFALPENTSVFPLYIEFSQEYLWLYGYREAFNRFIEFLKSCRFYYTESKISRGDVCVHTDLPILKKQYLAYLQYDPRCEVQEITELDFVPGEIGRLDIFKRLEQGYTGIRVGKGQPLMARIYNKSLEIKHSRKEWFNAIWKDKGLDITKPIINIEYEIKREWFYNRKIDSVEDFFANLGDIWLFLTKNYLSFRLPDNTRRSRRTICPWWENIRINTFDYNGSVLAKRERLEVDKRKSLQGMLGYTISYAAANDKNKLDLGLLYTALLEWKKEDERAVKMYGKKSIEQKIAERRNRRLIDLTYNPDSLFLGEENYENKDKEQ